VGVTSPLRSMPNFRQMSPDLSSSKGMSTPCSPPANLQNGHVVRQGAGRCLPICRQARGCPHRVAHQPTYKTDMQYVKVLADVSRIVGKQGDVHNMRPPARLHTASSTSIANAPPLSLNRGTSTPSSLVDMHTHAIYIH
jgi:hypothetical protein